MSKYGVSFSVDVDDQASKKFRIIDVTVKDLTETFDKASKTAAQTAEKVDQVGKSAKKNAKPINDLSVEMRKLAKRAATFALTYIGVKKVISTLAESSKMLAKVKTNTHASKEELDDLGASMLDLSKKTKYSNTELQHLAFLQSKSMNVKEIKATQEAIANAATATSQPLEETAQTILGLYNVFKKTGVSFQQTADIVAKSFDLSPGITSFNEFSTGMSYAALSALQYKKSLEEVSAVYSTLTTTSNASIAGNSIKQIFEVLGAPNKKSSFIFKKLGLSLKDVDLNSHSLLDVLKKIFDQFDKIAKVNPGRAAEGKKALFGTYSAQAEQIVRSYDEITEKEKKLKNSAGFGAEAAANQMNTLDGSLSRVKNSLNNLSFAFKSLESSSTNFLNGLAVGIDGLAKGIDWFLQGTLSLINDVGAAIDFFIIKPIKSIKEIGNIVSDKITNKAPYFFGKIAKSIIGKDDGFTKLENSASIERYLDGKNGQKNADKFIAKNYPSYANLSPEERMAAARELVTRPVSQNSNESIARIEKIEQMFPNRNKDGVLLPSPNMISGNDQQKIETKNSIDINLSMAPGVNATVANQTVSSGNTEINIKKVTQDFRNL